MANQLLTPASKVTVFFVVVAGLGGAVIAAGGVTGGLFFAGLVLAACLVFMPAGLSLWLLFIMVMLIVGQLTYFAGVQKAFWIPFVMGTFLTVRVFLELPRAATKRELPCRELPVFLLCLYLFFSVFLFSVALNKTSPFTALVSSKNYLFVWSIMFLIGFGAVAERQLENLWRFFLWIGVLQFPFAVIERFFFAKRAGVLNYDAVVGTFGGDPEGSGASAAMALFLVFTMLLASSLYSARRISGLFHWAVLICAIGAIAVAEVKVVFVVLPIGYLWLFRKQIPRNLGRTFVMGTLLAAMLAGVFYIYRTTIYSKESRAASVEATIERLFEPEMKAGFYDSRTGNITRTGALVRWWVLHPISEPAQFLFGHGPGASRRSQTAGDGAAARKYLFNISTSSASALLWDVGITGYISFVFILLFGAQRAERAARNKAIPGVQRSILQANAAALLITAMMTVHNRDAIDFAPVQFLISAMLGHLFLMTRTYAPRGRTAAPASATAYTAGNTPAAAR